MENILIIVALTVICLWSLGTNLFMLKRVIRLSEDLEVLRKNIYKNRTSHDDVREIMMLLFKHLNIQLQLKFDRYKTRPVGFKDLDNEEFEQS